MIQVLKIEIKLSKRFYKKNRLLLEKLLNRPDNSIMNSLMKIIKNQGKFKRVQNNPALVG